MLSPCSWYSIFTVTFPNTLYGYRILYNNIKLCTYSISEKTFIEFTTRHYIPISCHIILLQSYRVYRIIISVLVIANSRHVYKCNNFDILIVYKLYRTPGVPQATHVIRGSRVSAQYTYAAMHYAKKKSGFYFPRRIFKLIIQVGTPQTLVQSNLL